MPVRIERKIMCLCSRCNKTWQPRIDIKNIVRCPKCSSPYWNKKRIKKNDYDVKHHLENELGFEVSNPIVL